jgi:capping protein alpha
LDLENAAQVYLSGHYHSGVAAVLSPSSSQNQYTIQLVANKYNPSNFWSGRWRSEYTVDADQKKLTGRVLVNVHYYEQGNVSSEANNFGFSTHYSKVQLESSHSISLPLPTSITTDAASASKIFAIIESEESKFQNNLNDTYHDMGESTFKALRRALPLTRQKLDWDKVDPRYITMFAWADQMFSGSRI